ncbi:MAG: glycine--tRNA ligase subunit beta [Thermodesulfobacteriota bacterium]
MKTLLLEIGSEEIPAGYIQPALASLADNLVKKLDEARIAHGTAGTYGTPRRLAVAIRDVAARQTSLTSEMTGPPEKVGFDAEGRPTVAAEKFAEKAGIPVQRITIKETPKGRYLCAVKTEKGQPTPVVLKRILPEVIQSVTFPKRMKWGTLTVEFARPIQSILSLWGEQVIAVTIGDIKGNRYTLGHRFHSSGRLKVNAPEEYGAVLEAGRVIPDIRRRRQEVKRLVTEAAVHAGGEVMPDEELIDIVTNLVEYPFPVVGNFDEKFLELPKEVLITAMREHQKYFAVVRRDGGLMPHFIAVNNTEARDMGLVARGHERVLRARLEDARFFYRSDLESKPENLVDRLDGVMFQAKLGSMREKIERVRHLAGFLAGQTGASDQEKALLLRAAWLCKTDLVTQMVIEFPKLQGIMGRIYAAAAGEPGEVATAIEEHYRPTYSGGRLPETATGALLALADKMDSICGCFSVGLSPTGASDPYALRRQGIGIIQILLDRRLLVNLRNLVAESVSLFAGGNAAEPARVIDPVYGFLRDRMSHLLIEEGYSKDVVAAVTAISVDRVPDVWARARALANLKQAPDFEPLATAFKRVVNIIRKSEGFERARINPSLFRHASESALMQAFEDVRKKVDGHLGQGDFDQAMREIASLRPAVDGFFDGVLVMAEEIEIRNNRFALLAAIAALFETIADFSKITT